MVRLKNPDTGKMEEVDDYHYFDVTGHFPKQNIKKQYKLIKAFHPTKFEKGIYAVSFVEKGKPLVDKHTQLFQIKAKNKIEAIRKARRMLKKR